MGRKKPIWLCNCRYKDSCFLADECLVKCIVYKAEVTTTELSNYLWNISNNRFQYETKRNIAAYTSAHECGSKWCDLCPTERSKIMRKDKLLLNKNDENQCLNSVTKANSFQQKLSNHSLKPCIAIVNDKNQLNFELSSKLDYFEIKLFLYLYDQNLTCIIHMLFL